MLQSLHIENFAIIESVTCHFQAGMTVLTGETGAGKSIIIDAVSLLLGERASNDMIRYGASGSLIKGTFALSPGPVTQVLTTMGIQGGETLEITRELSINGKSTCRIQGQVVPLSQLRQLGPHLIDIHGQNEQFFLLNEEKQVDILDQYASKSLDQSLAAYQEIYQAYRACLKEIKDLQRADQDQARQRDILNFQIEEIEAANLQVGEEEELIKERDYFRHFQAIQEGLSQALWNLEMEDFSVLDNLSQAQAAIDGIASFATDYQNLANQLQDAYYQIQDALSTMQQELDHAEFDQERANWIEERLDSYKQLKHKYGASTQEVLDYLAKAKASLNRMDNKEAILQQLAKEEQILERKVQEAGLVLRQIRQEVGQQLSLDIQEELSQLYMEGARFQVVFEELEEPNEKGLDQVIFFIATNKGEPLKALSRVVSGGELSRITLALKSIFVRQHAIGTLIFDEIDTGVSGRVASAIANKMQYISEYCQVLCITHLPQVASMADWHIAIAKEVDKDRTLTRLHVLQEEDRGPEIARMLAGQELTSLSLETAQEFLSKAAAAKVANQARKRELTHD